MKRHASGFDQKNIIIFLLVIFSIFEAFLIFRLYTKKPIKALVPKKITAPLVEKAKKPSLGQIAIILDDWGYNEDHCQTLAAISGPITISVLPNLEYSTEMAQCGHYNNKEVIMHLPLEPHETYERYPKDYVLMSSMPTKKVEDLFEKALKSVPYAKGVNNHMGSKATENERFMRIVFDKLKTKGLFFIDSRVTNKSICQKLAKEMNIPFGGRDIFLDNENDRSYIEGQFRQLKELAKKRGFAIGIGHDRALTLQIVKEQLSALQAEGFQILTVGKLITNHENSRD